MVRFKVFLVICTLLLAVSSAFASDVFDVFFHLRAYPVAFTEAKEYDGIVLANPCYWIPTIFMPEGVPEVHKLRGLSCVFFLEEAEQSVYRARAAICGYKGSVYHFRVTGLSGVAVGSGVVLTGKRAGFQPISASETFSCR